MQILVNRNMLHLIKPFNIMSPIVNYDILFIILFEKKNSNNQNGIALLASDR